MSTARSRSRPKKSTTSGLLTGSHTAKDDYDQAVADYNEGIDISPEPAKSDGYRSRGEMETSFSKIERAIADYSEAIRLRDKAGLAADPTLYIWRANLHLAHAENDLALADLEQAGRIGTETAWLLQHRGLAYARKRMLNEAIADFEEGRKLAQVDKHGVALFMQSRADCLAMAGRFEEAKAGYADTVVLDPSRGHPALSTRAWFIDRPRGDYQAALEKLNETAKGGMIIQFLQRS